MTIKVDLHANLAPEDFKPAIHKLSGNTFSMWLNSPTSLSVFMSYAQLCQLRDVLALSIEEHAPKEEAAA